MSLILFVGLTGSGKTLSMVRYLYEDYLKGYKIYSNIPLSFSHTLIDSKTLQGWSTNDTQLKNASIGLDEGYLLFDSRRSGSKKSLKMTYFLLQSRKKQVNVLVTAQTFGSVDKRLRQNLHLMIECQFVLKGNAGIVINERWVRHPIKDWVGAGRIVFLGNSVYDLYDTHTIVLLED